MKSEKLSRYDELMENLSKFPEERLLSICFDKPTLTIIQTVLEYKHRNEKRP